MKFFRAILFSCAAGLAAVALADDLEYRILDLGTLGGNQSEALGLNDRSQAVGWSRDAEGRMQAFLWQNGTMSGLGFLPGGTSSVATAINESGDVTGYSQVSPTNSHAFLFSSNVLADLGTLGGPNSWGRAINDRRDVAGSSQLVTNYPSNSDPESFFWRTNRFTHLPPYASDHNSCDAYGVSAGGTVCGITFIYVPDGRWWAYIWDDLNDNGLRDTGEMHVLGSLGTDYSWGEMSSAVAINDIGQVVGWSGITNTVYPRRAILVSSVDGVWKLPHGDENTNDPTNLFMQALGTLGGPTNNSYATAINNRSWVVGYSDMPSGTNQAFLWRNGEMVNLNSLIPPLSGWVLTTATGINDHNEIVGTGLFQGQSRAYMLRQDGRITDVVPILSTNQIYVYTNELGEVATQADVRVETQVIQWAGIWSTNLAATHVFTVEYCDALQDHVWTPFPPTSQWPIAETWWTNVDFDANRMRHFRVRAQAQ